jgi:hypothetical protein
MEREEGGGEGGSGGAVSRPSTAFRAGSARPKTGRLKSARPPSGRPAAPRLRFRNLYS